MCHYFKTLLFSILIFIIFPGLIHAADFNIKLRKMDIKDLKQQLMPAVEQNIIYLKGLLKCLEGGKTVDTCFNEYSLAIAAEIAEEKILEGQKSEGKKTANSSLNQERNARIKQIIETRIKEKNIQQEQLVTELKKLLTEADEIKQCLYKGQTANELKNCIINP